MAAICALIIANSPLSDLYLSLLDLPVAISVGTLAIDKPLILWINDGLMAIFFFLIGLEIKREFLEGELSSRSQIALPAMAAVGGVIAPAAIYWLLNQGNPINIHGWAIPTATDIAFALGILALVGSRVPLSLKILLTAIAIFDDLAAIIIIALFYTSKLSMVALVGAGIALAGLALANLRGIARPSIYVVLGVILWVFTLKSGVHATLAGVAAALAIPLNRYENGSSMLEDLEHRLHSWVAFLILPLFAFANAGVSFAGIGLESFTEPVKLGISMGLFIGKQLGVFVCLAVAIRFGLSSMPEGATWRQLYGISLLCGIGFTMSLFIGSLAFELTDFDAPVRLGVLTGSLLSAVCGYVLLRSGPDTNAMG
jgi:NhaA family Na+:H+ antiporter